jgi:hypothetical protein
MHPLQVVGKSLDSSCIAPPLRMLSVRLVVVGIVVIIVLFFTLLLFKVLVLQTLIFSLAMCISATDDVV